MNKKMKLLSGLLLSIAAVSFTSCADVFNGDEAYESSVRNSQLQSPTLDNSCFGAVSIDGADGIEVTWPVVEGAGGYALNVVAKLSDGTEQELLDKSFIDGISAKFLKVDDDDAIYTITLTTLGNEKYNNTTAAEPTVYDFSKVGPVVSVPSGTDLVTFIQDYIKNDSSKLDEQYQSSKKFFEAKFILEAGQNYAIDSLCEVGPFPVSLVCNDETNPSTFKMGEKGSFNIQSGFKLQNIILECNDKSSDAPLQMSKHPSESIKGILSGTQNYYDVINNVVLDGCTFNGLHSYIFYDNKIKYCIGKLSVKDCVFNCAHSSSEITGQAMFSFYGGFVNDLIIENSTFWNSTATSARYFIQYNNSCRCDRGGYTSNSVTINNCTFSNIAYSGQFANYSGFAGRSTSTFVMKNCIFLNTGSKQIARRFIGGSYSATPTIIFDKNTYWYGDAIEDALYQYDKTGTQIEEAPQFKDPGNGDFTLTGGAQLEKGTGDPRWLK